MNSISAGQHTFIHHLETLVRQKDRGALATLRRGMGKPLGSVREMDSHVLRCLPSNISKNQEDAYYLVSALFAYWYQGRDTIVKSAPANLGASLRILVNSETSANREDAEKRIEKRLVALLNCHKDDLSHHLRHTIGLLRSKDICIDWLQLLRDIHNWQYESRNVQRNWARAFWRGFKKEELEDAAETLSHIEENTEDE